MQEANSDYQRFLKDTNLTEEYIQNLTHSVPFVKLNDDNLRVAESDIDGIGLFAKDLSIGSSIPALRNGEKTEAGRFVNHSDNPNAEMVVVNDRNIELITTRHISDEEITIDYRESNGAKQVARNNILALEETMKNMNGYDPGGKEFCKITHRFAPGVYAREMWLPAGCTITGKIHLTEHLNILSQGAVSVSNGGESEFMSAPHTFVSPVGTKRAIYAHEDSTWTTIHVTELTDPDKIEEEIIVDTFEQLDVLIGKEMKRISE